jgi:hypothetical protein
VRVGAQRMGDTLQDFEDILTGRTPTTDDCSNLSALDRLGRNC